MNSKTRKIVMSAMFAALVCVVTLVIKIPSPFKGYINIGDCVVLLSGWMLGPVYGFFASAIGSMLSDVISSYVIYAPVTFVIKGLMAVLAYFIYKLYKKGGVSGRILSGVTAEVLMILGYFIFEGILYGMEVSLLNIPLNGIQGVVSLAIAVVLIKIFEKRFGEKK